MEHLLLKAATTATDEGVFEAVISTPTVDRDKDIVEPQAMVNALRKWAELGKLVPLAWAHTDEVVGSVDPATVRVENGEVITKGQIDQTTDRGRETWRLVKSGTLSFSFGYLIPKGGANKQPGGRFRIRELDVFEISVVPIGPANNDTRVLSFKAVWTAAYINDLPDGAFLYIEPGGDKDEDGKTTPRSLRRFPYKDANGAVDMPHLRNALSRIPQSNLSQEIKDRLTAKAQRILDAQKSADPLRAEAKRLEREVAEAQLPELPPASATPAVEKPDVLKELQEVKARLATAETALEDLSKKAEEMDKDRKAPSMDPLRKRSEELALEVASDGMSLRRPPTKVEPTPPDLTDLRELKQQSRDLMDLLLSDDME